MKGPTGLALALVGSMALTGCSDLGTEPEIPTTAFETLNADRPSDPMQMNAGSPAPGDASIAAIAIDAEFDELVGALQYVDAELDAGLVELFLNGTDQYTVFAPTDAAFEDLYALLGDVLDADIDEVQDLPAPVVLDVLLYHVTDGRRASNSVVPPRRDRVITTLLGETFGVRTDATIEDGLTGLRTDATIVSPDISASNGIIHVIDQVIVPPSVVAALTS